MTVSSASQWIACQLLAQGHRVQVNKVKVEANICPGQSWNLQGKGRLTMPLQAICSNCITGISKVRLVHCCKKST